MKVIDHRPKAFTAVLAAAALMAVFATVVALTPSVPAEDRSVKPNYDWVVESSAGTIDKSWTVYAAEQRNRLFLVSSKGNLMLQVSIADKAVRKVDRAMTMRHPDGSMNIRSHDGGRHPARRERGDRDFACRARVHPQQKPPLIGPHTVEKPRCRPAELRRGSEHEPEGAVVPLFKATRSPRTSRSLRLVVPGGRTFPSSSGGQVSGTQDQVKLIGLPRGFETDQTSPAEGRARSPTFIIIKDGIEVGRIIGAPDKGTVEAAIAEVLRAKS